MKIFGFFCVQAIAAEETCNEGLSSNYCRTRGKTLDNDKLYNDAVKRYQEQEAEFNTLGQCYNDIKNWGATQGDREWDFKGCKASGKCSQKNPDGSDPTDQQIRDCCLNNDWDYLYYSVQNVTIFGQETLNQADELYNKMLNFKNCIGDHCGIDIKRFF
ncbi:Oidioi.mRNA.OKI2018_I69.PAR.g8679.t1.cds [Oikopleura dioica]|uniref:Oidioi.mRNA.OKI2018_I69.PAR.g8679.t1.cds n=1 Tax=Oikopleura dioica TaxID=34765 RepID=A0ABN7RN45_OIKDI|nr:Oidioi.mRNA.OKI2018_I69.PAR.g8679.t1.cds [Oikopleura dioica]